MELSILLKKKILTYLKGRVTEGERKRDFSPAGSLPNVCSSWVWAGLKPEARNCI